MKSQTGYLMLSVGLSCGLLMSCNSKEETTDHVTNQQPAVPIEEPAFEVKVFKVDSVNWGYDIYADSNIYIHQPHIPAISGNRGFRSADDARKTGELTIYKIRNNVIPPSLSIRELDSLGVLD